jgi:signal peptidase I
MSKTLRVLLWSALVIAAIIGLSRAIAVRWWRIPQTEEYAWLAVSVTPSLSAGDLILLWRLTEPAYGDLVLCPDPEAPGRVVVGRIVGEGKDEVKIDGSHMTVNGKRIVTETGCDAFEIADPQTGIERKLGCEMEVVGSRTHARGNADPKAPPVPVESTVPEGKVYLVSDNRQFPYDSRDFGPVDRTSCRETVFFRLLGAGGFTDWRARFTFIR